MDKLIAKDAIRDLVLRYCRAIDRRDYGALEKLYMPDAIDDHGGMFCGPASGFLEWLPDILESMQVTSHMITNHLITVDGDQAEGEVYCTAYHLTDDNEEIIIGGRYLDKYSCVDGQWFFQHRKIVMDWNQEGPASCSVDSPAVAGTPTGQPVESDPSTDFFDFLER